MRYVYIQINSINIRNRLIDWAIFCKVNIFVMMRTHARTHARGVIRAMTYTYHQTAPRPQQKLIHGSDQRRRHGRLNNSILHYAGQTGVALNERPSVRRALPLLRFFFGVLMHQSGQHTCLLSRLLSHVLLL